MSTMLYRQHPATLLRELQHELFPLLKQCQSANTPETSWSPKVDIHEEENAFVIYADIPGVDPKEIEIEMDNHVLSIKGERKTQPLHKGKEDYRIERSSGKFLRQFTLPESVDVENITATNQHGVLKLQIPKTKENKNYRKITVEPMDKEAG